MHWEQLFYSQQTEKNSSWLLSCVNLDVSACGRHSLPPYVTLEVPGCKLTPSLEAVPTPGDLVHPVCGAAKRAADCGHRHSLEVHPPHFLYTASQGPAVFKFQPVLESVARE